MNIGTDIFEKYDMISEAVLLRQNAINNAADLLINENHLLLVIHKKL